MPKHITPSVLLLYYDKVYYTKLHHAKPYYTKTYYTQAKVNYTEFTNLKRFKVFAPEVEQPSFFEEKMKKKSLASLKPS